MSNDAQPADNSSFYPWLQSYPVGIDWHATFKAQPLAEILAGSVARYPQRPCTNFHGRMMTYAEVGARVDEIAGGLQRLGVRKGTKVGLLLPNAPTFVIYYYAVLKCGGTIVNFNPLYTPDELAFQIKDSDTEIIVTLDLLTLFAKVEAQLVSGVLERAIVSPFPPLLPGAKSVLFRLFNSAKLASPSRSKARDRIVLEGELLAGAPAFQPPRIDPESDIAVIQYTGGTTGTPKGAMLTHANLSINVQQIAAWAARIEDGNERMLGVLPFFHVFAMTVVMNYGIAKAAEIYIVPRFVLDDTLALIDRVHPTVMPGVPTLFNAILHHPKLNSFDLRSLKFCLSGGAPLPPEVRAQFEAQTGCPLVEGYGLSETSPVVTVNPLDNSAPTGSIGLPLPATRISLRDLNDPACEVPRGERGELCVAGPQVMKGYYKRPEETAQQFVGEYLRTGDVAILDAGGYFSIVDRIKDLIICSGYNVYPRRIEDALYEHPSVEEAVVIGVKDEYRGEAPKAFVKLKNGQTATVDALRDHLSRKISKIEMPAEIELRDTLPRTMIGKLSKKELKAEEAARAQKG